MKDPMCSSVISFVPDSISAKVKDMGCYGHSAEWRQKQSLLQRHWGRSAPWESRLKSYIIQSLTHKPAATKQTALNTVLQYISLIVKVRVTAHPAHFKWCQVVKRKPGPICSLKLHFTRYVHDPIITRHLLDGLISSCNPHIATWSSCPNQTRPAAGLHTEMDLYQRQTTSPWLHLARSLPAGPTSRHQSYPLFAQDIWPVSANHNLSKHPL